jgi:MerR family mercuric resistance operon transcriptional regulator
MQIGEASAASGCHIETIRYYERVGLLSSPARTSGGYRAYRPEAVQRLRFITRGRELGFGLDEIRSLLTLADDPALTCSDVDRLARRHLDEIRERIRALNRMAKELERTITGCQGGRRAQCTILDALRAPATASTRREATGPLHTTSTAVAARTRPTSRRRRNGTVT